jgi:Tripartite tricarboxylate transporter TctB family
MEAPQSLPSRTITLSESNRVAADQQARPEAEEGAWARAVSARLGDVMMALALLATAVFFIWQAAYLPFGRVGLPGPGFFPFALGIVLGLFALAILYTALRAAEDGSTVFLGHRDVLVALAALAGVAFAFERADSYLVLGVFVALFLLVVAKAALWRVALGATLGMVAVWLVFRLALGVRLPAGEFWQQAVDFIAAKLPFSLP